MGYYLEKGVCLKLDVHGQGGGRILNVDGQGVGNENGVVFMGIRCVSSLRCTILKNSGHKA